MTRIAFALPTALADRLVSPALREGHEIVASVSEVSELLSVVATMRPEVAIVCAHREFMTNTLLGACDAHGVRLLAIVESDTQRRHAAALGLYETISSTSDWSTFEGMLRQDPVAATAVRSVEAAGAVIAVWGRSGAPGRTTLAIGIAAELAAMGKSVVLADADTHGASIAPALGMLDEAPGFAAACRLAGSDSLSSRELERIAQRHESRSGGFWVLTGIGRPSRWPELSGERVSTAISYCRSWVDFTVIDVSSSLENDEEISSDLLAPRRNAATVTSIRDADRVIAVGACDPVGLSRFVRTYPDLVSATAAAELVVVMNKVRATAIGANPGRQLEQTLARFAAIESPVLVPYDQASIDRATLGGRTLVDAEPKSAVRLAMRELVDTRVAPRSVAAGRRRR